MIVKRSDENPILKPLSVHAWEGEAVFNGCPIEKDGKIYLLYRALSLAHYHTAARANMLTSDIGIAESNDGLHFQNRRRLIVPENDWEKFGCEDPRVTKLGDKYYIFYTALSAYPFQPEGIKVALATSQDLNTLEAKYLVTPFNAKAMALFPEKIGDKFWVILTVHTDQPPAQICLASFDREEEIWSETYWQQWYKTFTNQALPLQRQPGDHLEVGTPPIKTKYGWLLLYSYIQNYFSADRLFTIEAVLLDLNNPFKILARTEGPILTAEEYYERIGLVPGVIFPSGAIIKDNWIYLYYGAADTTCCLALIDLNSLGEQLRQTDQEIGKLQRSRENPIIVPNKEHPWESKATFNPGAIYLDNKVHLLYRALTEDDVATLGYAASHDGIHFEERLPQPVYVPREPFEQKLQPGVGSGCEDPRLTQIGDRIYMCYTAFNGRDAPRIALTWINVKDFLAKQWLWAKPVLISPADLNDKDAFIFPEKVNGRYMLVHRVGYDIDYSFCPELDFKDERWFEEERWIFRRKGWWDSKKIGAAAPPIKTEKGWIMLYHGIAENGVYRVGAVLLDLTDPIKIIGRTSRPLLEPKMLYEREGLVPNVVFPCGAVDLGGKLFVYYGGADRVIGVATMEIKELLKVLELSE